MINFAIPPRPQPPRDGLRRCVDGFDAMNDLVDLEGREHPVDRCPRRFHRVALAAVFAVDAPADLKTRPPRWAPRPDAADIAAARVFLDGENYGNVPRPMP